MSDKKFTGGRRTRVRVELPAGATSDTADSDERRRRRSLPPADDDATRYVFRSRPVAVAFYDLATRLRSVAAGTNLTPPRLRELESSDPADPCDECFSEYASVRTGELGTEEEGPPSYTLYSGEDFAAVERGLLGPRHPDAAEDPAHPGEPLDPVDPFGFTRANGSGRLVSNCEELSTDRLSAEAIIFYVTTAARTHREQRPDVDDFNTVYTGSTGTELEPAALLAEEKWKTRESKPEDDGERWNQKDVDSGAAFRLLEIPKDARIKAEGQLIVGRLLDRLDEGGGAWFQFSNVAGHYYGFDTGDAVHYKITTEPGFDADAVTFRFKGNDNRIYLRPFLTAPPLASDFKAPVSSVQDNSFYVLPPGSLVAAIAQGSRVSYVWRVDESQARDVPTA